ncbi:MAG: GspH/FimT family pseudopilin [Betaproteobacteria bacterium]
MTAELLGWVGALDTIAKALVLRYCDYRPLGCLLPTPLPARSQPVPRHVTLRGKRGFTLIEFMVAVLIAGVLSGIAAPAFMPMIATQRVKTATFDLFATLTYARSEAIKRNSVVTIAPRGGNFSNGYDVDTGGLVLRSQLVSSGITIEAPGGIALAFNGYGRLTTTAAYQLELSSAQNSSLSKRCLIISPSGTPSMRMDSNRDGNCING